MVRALRSETPQHHRGYALADKGFEREDMPWHGPSRERACVPNTCRVYYHSNRLKFVHRKRDRHTRTGHGRLPMLITHTTLCRISLTTTQRDKLIYGGSVGQSVVGGRAVFVWYAIEKRRNARDRTDGFGRRRYWKYAETTMNPVGDVTGMDYHLKEANRTIKREVKNLQMSSKKTTRYLSLEFFASTL